MSVVIPAWVAADRLATTLAALDRCAGRERAQVVVVANGATAQVRDVVAAAGPAVTPVDSPVNRGFGGGCMLGAAAATAPLLVFLNDDAEPDPGWLRRLLATAEEYPQAGAIGSLLLDDDGLVEECGGELTADGWSRQLGERRPPAMLDRSGPVPVGYCSAAALLVRRAAFDVVGGFDPRYHPAYYEDVDLCVSLARAGWAVLVEPRAVVHHHRSASTHLRYRDYLSRRNHARFVAKWDWGGQGAWSPRPWPEPVEAAAAGADPLLLGRDLETARGFAADLVATADRLETDLVAARERIHHDHGELVALSERIHALQRRIDELDARLARLGRWTGRLPAPLRRLADRAIAGR